MNFILDENFPRPAIALLATYGHVGRSILEFSPKGSNDIKIFQIAQHEKFIFLTTDKDFFHTVPLLVKDHAGVIVITLHQPNRQKILNRLEWALRWLQQGNITGRVLLVTDYRYLISN